MYVIDILIHENFVLCIKSIIQELLGNKSYNVSYFRSLLEIFPVSLLVTEPPGPNVVLIMLECVYKPNLQSSSSPHDGSSACLFILPIRWRTLTYNPQDQIRSTWNAFEKFPLFIALYQVKHVWRMWYVRNMRINAEILVSSLVWKE